MSEVSFKSVVQATYIPESVEEVPILEGDNLLETIDYWNSITPNGLGIAWHGSRWPITQRIWRSQPYWICDGVEYPDSDGPIVCADATALVGAFYAVAPKGQRTVVGNENGGIEFGVRQQYREDFLRAVGYVVGASIDSFTEFNGGAPDGWPNDNYRRVPELRSPDEVDPLFDIRITSSSFFNLLDASPSSSLTYY